MKKVVLLFSLCLLACSAEETGGQRVDLSLRVAPAEDLAAPLETALGYRIHVTRALLSGGPVYFFSGPPIAKTPLWRRIFSIPEAHAHPGHYEQGSALGEVLAPWAIDLAVGSEAVASGTGVTGDARSASLRFHSPPASHADELAGAVILVEGKAERDAQAIEFRLRASDVDLFGEEEPALAGCPFSPGDIESNGTVTLSVDVEIWLDQVDFDGVAPADDGTRVDIEAGSRTHEGFLRGLKKAAAYRFSLEEG